MKAKNILIDIRCVIKQYDLYKKIAIITLFNIIATIIFIYYIVVDNDLQIHILIVFIFAYLYLLYNAYYNYEYNSYNFEEIIIYNNGDIKMKGFKYFKVINVHFNINSSYFRELVYQTTTHSSKYLIFQINKKDKIYIKNNHDEIFEILSTYFSDRELKRKYDFQLL